MRLINWWWYRRLQDRRGTVKKGMCGRWACFCEILRVRTSSCVHRNKLFGLWLLKILVKYSSCLSREDCLWLKVEVCRKQRKISLLWSDQVPVPRTALRVNWSGFECHGGNPQSNKTKWSCIDALSCFIWWHEINEL